MKSLQESLFDKDLAQNDMIYHPKTKDELIDCIKEQLDIQGPNANLNIIDVSGIRDMTRLFCKSPKTKNIENIDVSKWDVSNVKYMDHMFSHCSSFNSDLSKWDVSNVIDMYAMFSGCSSFNSDLSNWDVSNVKDMSGMFRMCKSFNSDLSKWDVRNAEDISGMFDDCWSFNSDLSKWDVSNVKDMDVMFYGCKSLKKIPSWYEKPTRKFV